MSRRQDNRTFKYQRNTLQSQESRILRRNN